MAHTCQYPAVLAALRTNFRDTEPEFKFHPVRKWRADFAIPSARILIEVDGGLFIRGRHSGGMGQIKDMEKGNAAAILGWRVLRFTPKQLGLIPAAVWAAANWREQNHEPTDRITRKRASALEKIK